MSLTGNAESGYTLRGKLSGFDTIRGYSAYEVAVINGFRGTEEEWLATLKGEKGDPGKDGNPGKDGVDGTVTFEELTDAQKETLRGEKGNPGNDGLSPTVAVEKIADGHRVSITDKDGTKTFDVMDGEDGSGTGDMQKNAYDANGAVATAGGIAGYVSSVVGDIDSVLDDINGEVV